MRKRFLSLLLALSLLLGIMPSAAAAETSAAPGEKQQVVYIPLDDRPFNDERVKLMAESLNIELIMPDKDLYATKLDNQPLNPNGTQYGNREALFTWLKEQDARYDTFILSLDQLLSGGLMNSRCQDTFDSLEFADGTTLSEFEVIDFLRELSQDNEIYLIDSVLRLATSCDYLGYNVTHYNLFRTYGMVGRPVLAGDDLTVQNIINNYPYGTDGVSYAYLQAGFSMKDLSILLSPMSSNTFAAHSGQLMEAYLHREALDSVPVLADSEPVDSAAIENSVREQQNSMLSVYLNIRQRKLLLTDYAMNQLAGQENVHYLLGVDDSSTGNNIQSNEIALFKTYLTDEDDQIFSSLDGIAHYALSQVFLSKHLLSAPKVSVSYLGDETDTVQAFNCYTPREMIDQTITCYGGVQISQEPELSIVVVTPGHSTSSDQILCRLVSLLNENEAAKLPTILVDLTGNQMKNFSTMLLENTHPGMLLSYSGHPEIPNGVIMALSQGFARYQSLTLSDFQTEETQQAHIKNLATALIKRAVYSDDVYFTMDSYLSELGLPRNNFGSITTEQQTTIDQTLTQEMQEAGQALLESFTAGGFLTSLTPYTTGSISRLAITDCTFPWLRQMEIDCVLEADWSDTPSEPGVFHRRYIDGTSETTFEPDLHITREESTKLLVSAMNLTVDLTPSDTPEDVSNWARPYVNMALEKGYVKGYEDGTFHGTQKITRAEFATLVIQYGQVENLDFTPVTEIVFGDVPPDSTEWYAENVYTLARAGLIIGDEHGNFLPDEPITRAEAVTLFNRLLGRVETLPDSLLQQYRFADVTSDWYLPQIQEASISHYCRSSAPEETPEDPDPSEEPDNPQ